MYHHSKIITMFAVLIIHNISNAGYQLAFAVQAFFMPGHIVYHIWYPCTPVWSVNASTAFEICDKQRDGHGYFHFKNVLLCLTIKKLSTLISTASERPPTKRVLLLSPSPAIPTLTSLPMASTCMAALSVTCAVPINPAIPLPDASTSPGVKRLRELPATKPLSSSWCGRTVNIAVMRQNAVNRNANGTCLHSSVVIRMQWYFRHISPDLYLSHQYYSLFPVATSSGIIAFYILICGHFVEFI